MKSILFVSLLSILCFSCSTISSTTYIKANESFVLGANKNHASYKARVKNIRAAEVKVIQINKDGLATDLGVLKANESASYRVAKSATIQFQNMADGEAAIKIKAIGDTNLSMAYKEND